jgi:signal transduction histidine kinase
MTLVVPRPAYRSSRIADRPPAVGPAASERSGRFIGLATMGVAAFSATVPLMGLFRMAAYPIDLPPTRYALAMVATGCFLPLHVWLVASAARDRRPRGRWWAAAAETAVIVGALPLVGIDWMGALYSLATLALITVRVPWSLLICTILAVGQASVLTATGHPDWAVYFTAGLLTFGPAVAVPALLLAKARELQAVRLAAAEAAVVRERLRIDDELGRTVGAELAAIAVRGDRAAALAARDATAAARELAALVDASRRTLARARRMVRQYQKPSLRAELDSAATLLSAAGISTQVVLPPGPQVETVPESLRAALQSGTARLLGDDAVRCCTIAVTREAGELRLEVRPDGGAPATGVTVR